MGVSLVPNLKPSFFKLALEKFCVGPKFFHEALAFGRIEEGEGSLARGGGGRRMRSGEQERARAVVEEVDEFARAADVTSHDADGFAERADLNVNAAVAAEVIDGAAAAAAEDAGGMGVINHHDAIVFFGEVAEFRERSDIAIHGEDAIGDEEFVAGPVFRFLADAFAIGDVAMLEDFDGGFGKAAAIDDGGVVELVGDDQIVFAEDGGDGACIGGEAGLKDDAGFGVFEFCDLLLERHVDGHGSGDGADGSGSGAEFADSFNGGLFQGFVGGEAEVVVGTEIDHLLAIEIGFGLLLAFKDAEAEVQALGFEIGDLFVQKRKRIVRSAHNSPKRKLTRAVGREENFSSEALFEQEGVRKFVERHAFAEEGLEIEFF